MQEITGSNNRFLEVDLTHRTFREFQADANDIRMYLGGKGLGLKMLYDRMPPGIDPLSDDNIIVFMTGVLLGTARLFGRFEAVPSRR